jgi:malate dehydrogenase (oxaloacetate-decarboxylating)(NADP+)
VYVVTCLTSAPLIVFQFEDFANSNAFRLLDKFQNDATVFNDDIQGTAAVVLSGVLAALTLIDDHEDKHMKAESSQLTKTKTTTRSSSSSSNKLADQRFLFYGAGSAGVGVADLLSTAIVAESKGALTQAEARKRIWLVDSKGLVSSSRDLSSLQEHKVRYAHDLPTSSSLTPSPQAMGTDALLHQAIDLVQPTALLGMSAQQGSFTKEICQKMTTLNKRPIIFALSNPTDKSECSAEQAYAWTKGKAIFASGGCVLNLYKYLPPKSLAFLL